MPTKDSIVSSDISAEGMLADSVAAAEGKLHVQGGGWNMIQTTALPMRHPRIGVALLIRVPYMVADNMPHKFSITLHDEDGHTVPIADAPPGMATPDGKLQAIEGGFTVGRPPLVQPGDEQAIPVAINIDGLTFQKAGAYVFRFKIDDRDIKALKFRVNHVVMPGMVMPR